MYRQMIKQGRGTYQLFNLQLKVFIYNWDGSYLVGGGIIASWGRCSCKPGNGVGCLGAMSYYTHWSTLASPMGSRVLVISYNEINHQPKYYAWSADTSYVQYHQTLLQKCETGQKLKSLLSNVSVVLAHSQVIVWPWVTRTRVHRIWQKRCLAAERDLINFVRLKIGFVSDETAVRQFIRSMRSSLWWAND